MKSAHVQVYWNRHRKMWSVRSAATRRVISHVPAIALSGCEFRVSQAGRQRAVETGKRNVHAVVCGRPLARTTSRLNNSPATAVTYNPFRQSQFTDAVTSRSLARARYVIFTPDGKARAVAVEFAA